ncbi:MAG: hypothetical protein LQ346_007038 [Caloplaca aetnensis]|nr:MAG: hypothetical protein LQ346_007038 [Caloplaca aetnensis]
MKDTLAPALEIVKLHETNFANSFAEKSPYRGPPTVELEAAWEELWNQPEILIPPSSMSRLNITGDDLQRQYVRAAPEEGDGYIGGLEVFHQIHCLVCPSTRPANPFPANKSPATAPP